MAISFGLCNFKTIISLTYLCSVVISACDRSFQTVQFLGGWLLVTFPLVDVMFHADVISCHFTVFNTFVTNFFIRASVTAHTHSTKLSYGGSISYTLWLYFPCYFTHLSLCLWFSKHL